MDSYSRLNRRVRGCIAYRRRYATCAQAYVCFFFQAEDGIRDLTVTGVQTCALPISARHCAICPKTLCARCCGRRRSFACNARGPNSPPARGRSAGNNRSGKVCSPRWRSEEHTSELQSQSNLVCRLLLEKKKINECGRMLGNQLLPAVDNSRGGTTHSVAASHRDSPPL